MAHACSCRVLARLTGIVWMVGLLSTSCFTGLQGSLVVGYYASSCPAAESIVRSSVTSHFLKNPNVAPQLLRLHFHDCALTGCDGSILLNGTNSEQKAPPNLSVAGFDVINDAKTQLEARCSGIVSCSDIVALAARDAVALSGGVNYSVPTGRFDGNVSAGVQAILPSPSISVDACIQTFAALNLTVQEMVLLLGAHTIGTAACSSFSDRLFNFNKTGKPDPTIGPIFLKSLQQSCPQNGSKANFRVALDNGSQYAFDTHFYTSLNKNHGVLGIDQELSHHPKTQEFVNKFAVNRTLFYSQFAAAIIKMGQIRVLTTGSSGEIRKQCFTRNKAG